MYIRAMRTLIVAVLTAVLGVGVGWLLRGQPTETLRVVTLPPKTTPVVEKKPEPEFPDYPKPPVEPPKPIVEENATTTPAPPPLVGNFQSLPETIPNGLSGPLEPALPDKVPAADLNADEALARRTILQAGGEIVSSADAKDTMGKVGKTLVAEISAGDSDKLKGALRKALGDRIILSDAGTSNASNPATKKAEEALEAKRKERDKARIDFLPEAPILRQIEEEYRAQERALADLKKSGAKQRITILIRPTLGAG